MNSTEQYLEPLKYYEMALKDLHKQNTEELFDELTNQSQIDTGANKATCTKYYAEKAVLDKLTRSLNATKGWIIFMIILMVIGFVLGLILLIGGISNVSPVLIGVGVGLIALGIGALVLWLTVFKKKKNNLQDIVNKKQKIVDGLQNEAYNQVAALNSLFTPDIPTKLIHKSAPLIEFDKYLSSKTEDRIINQFEDELDTSKDHSSLVVISGNINTNPFLLRQKLVMKMLPEVYHGSLVITYTRTVSDGKGGTRTVVVTQTLHATVTRPKPHYSVETGLTYYTDAASKLSFYRTPAGMVGLSDSQIQRRVKKEDKENTKLAEKARKTGGNYTKFANSKFEAYVNSEKRNNELEYRLLFTPLAQNNFVYSFSKHDDIYFDKDKCVNNIYSTHDTNMDYSGDISNYYHFDYEVIKEHFREYNTQFFDGLYFDMIPLLSIPLYHQHQSAPFIDHEKEKPISYYESEVLVNKFEPDLFKPSSCSTDVILKANLTDKGLNVTAYGFTAIPKTEFVPTMGGDGHMHPVPVNYYEYKRVNKTTPVNLFNKPSEIYHNKGAAVAYRKFIAAFNK